MKHALEAAERFLFHPVVFWLLGAGATAAVLGYSAHPDYYGNGGASAFAYGVVAAGCFVSGALVHRRRGGGPRADA